MKKKKPSPYPGAGPWNSALPASVIYLEEIRQGLMRAGMADIPIHDWPASKLVDCMIRNNVKLSGLTFGDWSWDAREY